VKLAIGLLSESPAWQIILNQIGVDYFHLYDSQPDPNEIPIIILDQESSEINQRYVLEYVSSGGNVILDAKNAKLIFNKNYKTKKIKYLKFNNDSIFTPFHKCNLLPKNYKISSESNHLLNQNNIQSIAILNFDKGKIVVLPQGIILSIVDRKAQRQNFPAFWGERLPNERVNRASKSVLRQMITDILMHLFHIRDLPFVTLSPIPNGADTCFIFRIDTDMAGSVEIKELYDLCVQFNINATWFIETKSITNNFVDFTGMKNQEIAYHCYRHKLFRTYKKQKMDFEKGLQLLQKASLNPKGYAAPFGEWTTELMNLLEKFNFEYSSEFSLNYDDLPFFPWLSGRFSSVLQIPIHPISTGRLSWARFTEKEMLLYYSWIIDQKKALGLPIILYHHPGPKYLRVIHHIFEKIQNDKIESLDMLTYSNWWKKRLTFKLNAHFENQILFDSSPDDLSQTIRILNPDGNSYSIKNDVKTAFKINRTDFFQGLGTMNSNRNWRLFHNNLLWHYRKFRQ
jgi:hypothetical protein